ncbi:MAG: tyrosine-type recombinase/integrase [Lachnospiraceae bacterium]
MNGSIKRKTVYGRSIEELDKKRATVISDVSKGCYADDQRYTLSEYAYEWLATYKNNVVSQSTYNGYRNIIKNHFGKIAHKRLKELKKSDVQNCMNNIDGQDLKRRFRLTINQILDCAIDDGLIYKNVARNVPAPSGRRKEKRALTTIEKKAIESADLTPKEDCFVKLLLYTGMRRSEILVLTRNDIDLDGNVIYVNKSLYFDNNRPVVKDTKTEASFRQIDILSPLKPILVDYIKNLDKSTLMLFSKHTGGGYMTKTAYRRFWDTIYRKINTTAGGTYHWDSKKKKAVYEIEAIKGLTPHIFRHNFATMLYYANVDLKDAVRIMGHADSKTLLDIYTHLDENNLKSVSKLELFLAKSGSA